MRDFQNYRVWENAHQLTLAVYATTVDFPREEPYGLRSEIRRSCASVPANIAEGSGHDTDADFARFLEISAGSLTPLAEERVAGDELARGTGERAWSGE